MLPQITMQMTSVKTIMLLRSDHMGSGVRGQVAAAFLYVTMYSCRLLRRTWQSETAPTTT